MKVSPKIIIPVFFFLFYFQAYTQTEDFKDKLSSAAIDLTRTKVSYDPTYTKISYPNGDVASDRGVCTDVIIRAYRKLGIDLQKEVHLDMKTHFSLYPSKKRWGMKSTDTNIDHRRVPNLQTFFTRKGKALVVSEKASNYEAGDLVTWDLGGGIPHIGIVVAGKSRDGKRPLIVHNVGRGQVLEDVLFDWKITGHYTYQ